MTVVGLGYIFAINGEDPHHTLVVFLARDQLGCLLLNSMMVSVLKGAKDKCPMQVTHTQTIQLFFQSESTKFALTHACFNHTPLGLMQVGPGTVQQGTPYHKEQ